MIQLPKSFEKVFIPPRLLIDQLRSTIVLDKFFIYKFDHKISIYKKSRSRLCLNVIREYVDYLLL